MSSLISLNELTSHPLLMQQLSATLSPPALSAIVMTTSSETVTSSQLPCKSPNNTSLTTDPDSAFELFRVYFVSWFLPVNILLGLSGNIVNLGILSRGQVFSAVTASLFLSLAVADILSLIFAAGYLYISVVLEQDTMQYGPLLCHIVPYAEAVGYWLSPWLQATVSVHRMVAVRFPLKSKVWLTLRRTRLMIFVVTATVFLYAFIIPINHRWSYSCNRCMNTGHYYVYYSHGVFGSFIPFGIMILSTSVIIYSVCRSGVAQHMTSTADKQDSSPTTIRGVSCTQGNGSRRSHFSTLGKNLSHRSNYTSCSIKIVSNSSSGSQRSRLNLMKNTSERRITTMLIMMNLTYFLTNGAGGVFLLLRVHLVENDVWWIWHTLHRFFDVVTCINNSTNWAFYLLSGAHYRRTFFNIISLTSVKASWRSWFKNGSSPGRNSDSMRRQLNGMASTSTLQLQSVAMLPGNNNNNNLASSTKTSPETPRKTGPNFQSRSEKPREHLLSITTTL